MTTSSNFVPLEKVTRWSRLANSILGSHLGITDYLLAAVRRTGSQRKTPVFEDNEKAWQSLARFKVSAGMRIVLKDFMVFDWFPRSPGLFHTSDAPRVRAEAFKYLHPGFQSPIRDHAAKVGDERPDDYTVVFDPYGKLRMLEGGVGAIRVKPILIFGKYHWLMTASSDGITHTGVPIAVPEKLYPRLLPSIHENGALCATISGVVEFVPDPFSRLFDQAPMVPKVLIRVTKIGRREPKVDQLESSVAVSFVSDFEGRPEVYASYVTFQPNIEGSFEDAISWMKKEYVEGAYCGRIITDFDQTRTIFPEARLALSKVMDRLISRGELRDTIELMHATASAKSYFDELARCDLLPKKTRNHRTSIFISYAHAAERQTGWVARIKKHLQGVTHLTPFEVWTDRMIEPGRKWADEIRKAIGRSRIAILVLTADFLASSFIREAELPPLLETADADGATIFCIYGSHVHLSGVAKRLLSYQFVNDPQNSLQSLSESDREFVYTKLAEIVEKNLSAK